MKRVMVWVYILATVILSTPQLLAAELSEDCGSEFTAYIGRDRYRFNPKRPGPDGQVRLIGEFSFERAASVGEKGTIFWKLVVRGPNGSPRAVMTTDGVVDFTPESSKVADVVWTGRDDRGLLVPEGEYTFTFLARYAGPRAVPNAAPYHYDAFDRGWGTIENPKSVRFDRIVEAMASSRQVMVDYTWSGPEMTAMGLSAVCQMQQRTPIDAAFPYNFYYGSTHAHSNYSDGGQSTAAPTQCSSSSGSGRADPATLFAEVRDNAYLDYWVINEHNHLLNDARNTRVGTTYLNTAVLQDYQTGRTAAANVSVNDVFIGLYGMEWGTISGGGHVTILETPALMGWETCGTNAGPCYDVFTSNSTTNKYSELYEAYAANPSPEGAMGIFCHPGTTDFQDSLTGAPSAKGPNADAAMAGIAVRTGPAFLNDRACSTASTTAEHSTQWRTALNSGWHLAPASDHDSHCAGALAEPTMGASNKGRTVAVIPNGTTPVLSRASLRQAFDRRHFFATEDSNAQLVFATTEATPHVMGDIFTTGTSITLRASVNDPGSDGISYVRIWRGQIGGGILPAGSAACGAPDCWNSATNTLSITENIPSGSYYYYVYAVQADGDEMWSAPMWITYGGATCGTNAGAPLVGIASPANNATIACADTTVTVCASDTDNISGVSVRIDGGAWQSATSVANTCGVGSTTWQYTWNSLAASSGAHTIEARATDSHCAPLSASTAPLSVTVDNSGCVPPSPVQSFTVTSTSATNVLEWVNPASGPYTATMIRYSTTVAPATATDGTELAIVAGSLGSKGTSTHTTGVLNGTTYHYSAFAQSATASSSPRSVTAKPEVTTGPVKWKFQTGATTLNAPTLNGAIFTLTNENLLHSMSMTASGGLWPSGWMPAAMNAPAQGRAPVWLTTANPIKGKTRVVVAASQDGRVYCVDAATGANLWTSSVLGDMLQAAPIGIMRQYGSTLPLDLVLVATRNSAGPNEIIALNAADGTVVWSFDNAGEIPSNAIGIISASPVADVVARRVYFTSYQAAGGTNQTVWCLNYTASGATVQWSAAIGNSETSPGRRGGRIYTANTTGDLYAFAENPAGTAPIAATPIWTYATADGGAKALVWTDWATNDLYFSTVTKVWAITDAGGSATAKWSTTLTAPSHPVLANEVWVGSGDGAIRQLSKANGGIVGELDLGTAAVGPAGFDYGNNLVHFGSEAGVVYAIVPPLPCPIAPPAVTATATSNQVTLNWAIVPGATSYTVYRASGSCPGTGQTVLATGVAPNAYTDSTAVNGTTYSYQVVAVGACNSLPSECDAATPTACTVPVFINEFHYDNSGTDAGEFIEIAGPANTDLSAYSLVLYNGNGGVVYATIPLTGLIDNENNGFGAVSFAHAGIQNDMEGIALVRGSTVIQFLNYEGTTLVAADGPAAGMTSVNIGVSEATAPAAGNSLQLKGTGACYSSFVWNAPSDDSPGSLNIGQTFP